MTDNHFAHNTLIAVMVMAIHLVYEGRVIDAGSATAPFTADSSIVTALDPLNVFQLKCPLHCEGSLNMRGRPR